VEDVSGFELVLSNAALHWVPHEQLLPRWLDGLRPGAQIAVQVPRNVEHPSHRVAMELVETSWKARVGEPVRSAVLPLERYAEMLHEHGFVDVTCMEKVYGHVLAGSADVVEWVKGTLLTPYLSRLDAGGKSEFLDEYRGRLLSVIGKRAPYFYTYRRTLFVGTKR
jgi:trans-aconitate 2-methyltransferase